LCHRGTSENPLQLLRLNFRLHKGATADQAVLGVDQITEAPLRIAKRKTAKKRENVRYN
jgi:hypothetical protein